MGLVARSMSLELKHPQGLKPGFFGSLDAALKRRSSTVVRAFEAICGTTEVVSFPVVALPNS
jgi:hypothetical protein